MQVAAIGDGDDGGGGETRVAVAVRRREALSMMVVVVVVVEEVLISLATPKQSASKSRCLIWASCGREGKEGCYIALISICNKVQHGAGGYCEFLAM